LTDHLGSTVSLSDSNGSVTESATYDSFGNKTGTLSTRYGYTGREADETTGLMYYRARFYDPQIGRFTSEDPIGFAGGDINLYGYVSNDPLIKRDSLGLWPSVSPFDTHQKSARRVLKGRLSEEEIEIVANTQRDWDEVSQDEKWAFAHAMTMVNEKKVCARIRANQWVYYNITSARAWAGMGYRKEAMYYLGRAVHAMQDSTSPAHANFQPAWKNSFWSNLDHSPHYVTELFDPGKGSELDAATERAYKYFSGELPMPNDFFGNRYDTHWGPAVFRVQEGDPTECQCQNFPM
jgi:RHS repeat-associated protein